MARDPLHRETDHHSKSCRTRFFAALHIELPIDTANLRFHGVDGDDQRLSDLRVRQTAHQQTKHTLLLWAEWLDEPGRNERAGCKWGLLSKLLLGEGTQ